METSTFAAEGLQMLTFTRRLAIVTYFVTVHPLIKVIFEDTLPSVWQWNCHYTYSNDLCLSRPRLEPQPPPCESNALPTEPLRWLYRKLNKPSYLIFRAISCIYRLIQCARSTCSKLLVEPVHL